MTRFVLVGGGVATVATAVGLRQAGFDGEIVLVAAEPHLPCERPPLSKGFLSGSVGVDSFTAADPDWYTDHDVQLVLGTRVAEIRLAERRVSLSTGGVLGYDGLVLGTGARPRTLPGLAGDRVHALRTIADAQRLAGQLGPGRRLGIVGAGFVGCEVAAVATVLGSQVTVVDPTRCRWPGPSAPRWGAPCSTCTPGTASHSGPARRWCA